MVHSNIKTALQLNLKLRVLGWSGLLNGTERRLSGCFAALQ